MAKKKIADLLVEVLAEAGVREIYGVSGDSLNGIITGRLAVCAGSCGPGNLHLNSRISLSEA